MIVIHPHRACVNVVCFTPDGGLLASVSEDGWAKVWNPAQLHTGKPVWEVDAESDDGGEEDEFEWFFLGNFGLSHAQFTPDGKYLITSGWNRHLRAWHAKTGKPKWEVRKPRGYGGVGTLVASRDGKHVAFAGGHIGVAERVFILDPKDETEVRSVKGHADACGALAAGPDGFASGSADKHVKFWTWGGTRCYHDMALRGVVRGLMFSPDGSRLAASGGAVVMVWDMLPPLRGKGSGSPAGRGSSAATPTRCRRSTSRPTARRSPPRRMTARCGRGTRPPARRFAPTPRRWANCTTWPSPRTA
jgi:hypothetical protein